MGQTGWFPRSLCSVRRGRSPAIPLRHRHGYAAVLHRGLPTDKRNPSRSSRPCVRSGAHRTQPRSTRFELVDVSRGLTTLVSRVLLFVSLAGPAPSGGAGTSRRCQGCSHPSRHLPDPAAPSFTVLLRQERRCRYHTPTRIISASRRTRVQVEPDDVDDLVDELRVGGQLEGVLQVGLETEVLPNPADGRFHSPLRWAIAARDQCVSPPTSGPGVDSSVAMITSST